VSCYLMLIQQFEERVGFESGKCNDLGTMEYFTQQHDAHTIDMEEGQNCRHDVLVRT
jgi:hypothetical protein